MLVDNKILQLLVDELDPGDEQEDLMMACDALMMLFPTDAVIEACNIVTDFLNMESGTCH